MALAPLSAGFQSLPTIKLGLSGAASRVGGLVYALGPCGSLHQTVRLGVSPAATSTPTGIFNQWFEALFPRAGTLGCEVCNLIHQLLPHGQLQLCPPSSTICDLAGSTSCCLAESPLRPAAHLHPSYWSGWMFLLYLLGCWTCIQLDFLSVLVVFKFVVVLLLVVWGGTVCLPTPPSWPEVWFWIYFKGRASGVH